MNTNGEFLIHATPTPDGRWSLLVEGIGVSSVARFEDAGAEMLPAIADLTGLPAEHIHTRTVSDGKRS